MNDLWFSNWRAKTNGNGIKHSNRNLLKAEMWCDWVAYFEWQKPGNDIILIWGLHWDEKLWWEIVEDIFKWVVNWSIPIKWKLLLILANPKAYREWKKFIEFDNLNWLFWLPWWEWTYEYKRAQLIMESAKTFWPANLALDLHQSYKNNLPLDHYPRAYGIYYPPGWLEYLDFWINVADLWIAHVYAYTRENLLNWTLTWWLASEMQIPSYVFEIWSTGQSLPDQQRSLPGEIVKILSWWEIRRAEKQDWVRILVKKPNGLRIFKESFDIPLLPGFEMARHFPDMTVLQEWDLIANGPEGSKIIAEEWDTTIFCQKANKRLPLVTILKEVDWGKRN